MNFLKRIWRKIFKQKTGVYPQGIMSLHEIAYAEKWSKEDRLEAFRSSLGVYDPLTDEDKILKGEVESYFD